MESSSGRNMFGSAQCLGYRNEFGSLTDDLCYPPQDVIVKQVRNEEEKKFRTLIKRGINLLFVLTRGQDIHHLLRG